MTCRAARAARAARVVQAVWAGQAARATQAAQAAAVASPGGGWTAAEELGGVVVSLTGPPAYRKNTWRSLAWTRRLPLGSTPVLPYPFLLVCPT